MLIALAGLPGTGKSTLAARLADALGGVVLGKDTVRAALFPPPVLDYSPAENAIAMAAIFHATEHIRRTFPDRPVIIDGRTFLRTEQVRALFALATSLGETPHIIECTCADEVARQRLEHDLAAGTHPAKNRTFALYQAVKAQAQPLTVARLVLDTGTTALDECVRRCLAFLHGDPA